MVWLGTRLEKKRKNILRLVVTAKIVVGRCVVLAIILPSERILQMSFKYSKA